MGDGLTDLQAPDSIPGSTDTFVARGLRLLWRDRRTAIAVAVVVPALAALLCALAMPRGPITTTQALVTMVAGLLTGGSVGLVLRSRWAMALAPAVFVAVYEMVRIGSSGPTVDAMHADVIGIIAIIVGRGVHGLLALVPMILGAAYGAALARRWCGASPGDERGGISRRGRIGRVTRRTVTGIVTIGVLALAFVIALPAATAPILTANGDDVPEGVAELATLEVGGQDQVVMIRGRSTENPVLLFLAGGPGGTDIGAMRLFGEQLEQRFVVATWDQRGAGKSRAALDPTETYTLDRIVADTIEVTEYLRQRFDEQKIYLVGNSWGTTLGVLAAQQRPDLYSAFVGTGQMVSETETDRMFLQDSLTYARSTGNADLEATLLGLGESPYADVRAVMVVAGYERKWNDYPRVPAYAAEGEMPMNLMVDEYSLMDKINAAAGTLDTFMTVYPQLAGIDFRVQAKELGVPVYLVEGRYEARGRAVLAREWFDLLQAPSKQWITFDNSGHRPLFEEPDRFFEVMTGTVLAETS
jgi:proline iminopeptidase